MRIATWNLERAGRTRDARRSEPEPPRLQQVGGDTDKAWQASVTDEQIKKTILLGGAPVGKSPIMPGSPDLDSKPEVVDGLVKIVCGFAK